MPQILKSNRSLIGSDLANSGQFVNTSIIIKMRILKKIARKKAIESEKMFKRSFYQDCLEELKFFFKFWLVIVLVS